jgi:hypothetical protein
MNLPLTLGVSVLAIVVLAIVIELSRVHSRRRRRLKATNAPPARSKQLERRMLEAFTGPRKVYGDLFAEFSVWRQAENARMDVRTRSDWGVLNVFTRSLIVRHLWQTLASLVKGTAVVRIDLGTPDAIVWNAAQNERFDDKGVVPAWVPAKGRVGTLISGR